MLMIQKMIKHQHLDCKIVLYRIAPNSHFFYSNLIFVLGYAQKYIFSIALKIVLLFEKHIVLRFNLLRWVRIVRFFLSI